MISFSMIVLNTVFFCILIYLVVIFKVMIPNKSWRLKCSRVLTWLAELWAIGNDLIGRITHDIKWHINTLPPVDMNNSYLVLANHQTWADIFVLTHTLNKKIPFMRFFIKRDLRWVPFLGGAWWALDYPFVNRFSKEYLEKHPEMRGKDLETTKKSCERFKDMPTSILNFVEGTRLNKEKYEKSNSPFKNLLPPKTGGIFTVLEAMGEQLHSALVVSIVYEKKVPNFWELCSGKAKKITVCVEQREIPLALFTAATNDKSLDYLSVKNGSMIFGLKQIKG